MAFNSSGSDDEARRVTNRDKILDLLDAISPEGLCDDHGRSGKPPNTAWPRPPSDKQATSDDSGITPRERESAGLLPFSPSGSVGRVSAG